MDLSSAQFLVDGLRSGFACAIQICSQLTREKDAALDRRLAPDYMVEDIYDVATIVRDLLKG